MRRWTGSTTFYISDSKVEMLSAQIPVGLRDRIAADLKIDLKLFAVSLRERASDETRYSKLQLVCNFLERESLIGTLQKPAPFVHATLPMRWGPLRNEGAWGADSGAVFFGSVTPRRGVVALGGSAKHVIGASGNSEALAYSTVFGILRAIIREPDEVSRADPRERAIAAEAAYVNWDVDTSAAASMRTEGEAIGAVYRAATEMPGPEQRLEFLAKPLLRGDAFGEGVLLATPIYVALVD